MKKAVEKFIQRINEIQEIDYGDFMRRANNYLMDLQDHIAETTDVEAQRLLADMNTGNILTEFASLPVVVCQLASVTWLVGADMLPVAPIL